ncbi:MAG: type IV toxin-antitoxin system AbiEi family antitoxin, partial [Candidatus Nanopelagicales bacterium]
IEADGWLRVAKDKQHVDYVVEAKRAVVPATLGAVVTQLRQFAAAAKRPPLLVTDYVTPPLAEKLRALDQQFVDGAGNAYLNGPGFLVYVTGRKAENPQGPLRPGRTFTTTGLKVLFALICDARLAAAPYRMIAQAADVALGALPPVLRDLEHQRYLLVAGKNRRLVGTKRLLDDWAFAYARTLRAKVLTATYVAPKFETWPDWELDPNEARWGGEPAANLLVEYLRPGVLTIYARKLTPRLVVEQRLVVAGRLAQEGLLEVRRPFWGATLKLDGHPKTVPPALVYADLLAIGDARCIETAQMVYDEFLARLFAPA